MNKLSSEIINYISGFMGFLDKYSFARTNTFIYNSIWYTNKDLSDLCKLLFFQIHLNLYGTFFSDKECDWIQTYFFQWKGENFLKFFRYQDGYLWIKIEKISEEAMISETEINHFKQLGKMDYILVYSGDYRNSSNYVDEIPEKIHQIEFKKWIGTLNLGYYEILEKINKEFCQVLKLFQSYLKLNVLSIEEKQNKLLKYFLNERIKILCLEENKEFSKEEIFYIYYQYAALPNWNSCHQYIDFENLRQINKQLQKNLSIEIYKILKSFHLVVQEKDDMEHLTIKKLSSYLSKNYLNLI
jgi:hypothetical protein